MEKEQAKQAILNGEISLGMELGSTRIKSVLIDHTHAVLATGEYDWENQLINGIWTYHLEDIIAGIQGCYRALADNVASMYGVTIAKAESLGVSGMMHGYLAFDEKGQLLVPFRTWRNTMTEQASKELSAAFNFNIPQRWSIAHLYQAILNQEEHIPFVRHLTTLAGYVHGILCGENVLGVGEASGMFPIDTAACDYDQALIELFDKKLEEKGLSYRLRDILPRVLPAGEQAGVLTEEGARLLDPSGSLAAGIPLCPPEGDAGTGMVATNSVAVHTGNVSAGTSIFAMAVLEKKLSKVYPEIDLVTTPAGKSVAMVHCNNCTSDLNAWANLLCQFAEKAGLSISKGKALDIMFDAAMSGDVACSGLLAYNYYSGEHTTGFTEGRPLFARMPDADFSLANFARVNLYAAISTLKLGMDLLLEKEQVRLDKIYGHGGFFKAKDAGQKIMTAALGIPVSVMETANEGGAWGMAILASYMVNRQPSQSLEDYLNACVFAGCKESCMQPDETEVKGFQSFAERYKKGFSIEHAAVSHMNE